MILLDRKEIKKILPRVQKGLYQYLCIQNYFRERIVDKDREFQRRFNAFYRVRRGRMWQKGFYAILQEKKNRKYDFRKILLDLQRKTKRVEASFASKLIATLDPKNAVIDSIVLRNLRIMGNRDLKLPYPKSVDRIERIIIVYEKLNKLYREYLRTPAGRYLVGEFKKMYPNTKISDEKKLDLVLWQKR